MPEMPGIREMPGIIRERTDLREHHRAARLAFRAFLAPLALLDRFDGDVHGCRRNGLDAELLRWVDLDAKIVLAGSEAGKVHERVDRVGLHAGQRLAAAAAL